MLGSSRALTRKMVMPSSTPTRPHATITLCSDTDGMMMMMMMMMR
jgi:hypothetical protein